MCCKLYWMKFATTDSKLKRIKGDFQYFHLFSFIHFKLFLRKLIGNSNLWNACTISFIVLCFFLEEELMEQKTFQQLEVSSILSFWSFSFPFKFCIFGCCWFLGISLRRGKINLFFFWPLFYAPSLEFESSKKG